MFSKKPLIIEIGPETLKVLNLIFNALPQKGKSSHTSVSAEEKTVSQKKEKVSAPARYTPGQKQIMLLVNIVKGFKINGIKTTTKQLKNDLISAGYPVFYIIARKGTPTEQRSSVTTWEGWLYLDKKYHNK